MMKLNNKGFAITTIIYGLAIMSTMILTLVMSTLANTKKNNNNMSKEIENELNKFSETSIIFDPAAEAQEYKVPAGEAGWYRIELWGAQGGGSNGGLGAYTSGIIKLGETDTLYFVVGRQGSDSIGGESTDVRLENTTSVSSEKTRIMVAAGGGVNPGSAGGTLVGYNSNMLAPGGMIKSDDNYELGTKDPNKLPTLLGYEIDKTNGSSSFGTSEVTQSGIPKGNDVDNNQGGEGYFTSTYPNYGGVSFISGYAGSRAYVGSSLTNSAKYTYYGDGKDYYFVDGVMYPGVKSGNGQAKIERLMSSETIEKLPRQNTKLNEINAVRDCVLSSNSVKKIAVSFNGETITGGLSEDTSVPGYACKILNLTSEYDVDEVAVFHDPGYDYRGHTIEVHKKSGWQKIKGRGAGYEITETETATGIRVSAYQPDYTTTIPKSGNYYIIPVTAEGKVVSGFSSSEDRANSLQINSLVGEIRQRWSIEKLDEKLKNPTDPGAVEYKIVELSRYNALTIYRDENIEGNQLIVSPFNNIARNEPSIWKVTPMGDGTVTITSSMPSSMPSFMPRSGNIYAQTNSDPELVDSYNTLLIGANNNKTQRFKLIKLDF